MFRLKDAIRLTSLDLTLFARVTGIERPPPTTVVDYNRRLAAAEQIWGNGQTPAERLLAGMARAMMLDPLDPTDVLNKGRLSQALV